MNINEILQELDAMFFHKKINEVEPFLLEKLQQANELGEQNIVITLMNELIGFYRDTSQYEKSVSYCNQVVLLMKHAKLEGSIPYATTLLNVANAYRAAGLLQNSFELYQEVMKIYEDNLEEHDFRFASLNNNLSLLYQEMNEYRKAVLCLEKALGIVSLYPEAKIELATTHTNLAMSLLKLNKPLIAEGHLEVAFKIFETEEVKDFHYSGALSAMGEAKYQSGQLKDAAYYYEKALEEIEINVGRTKAYEITKENLTRVLQEQNQEEGKEKKAGSIKTEAMTGLTLCEAYYKEYGAPMINQRFSQYSDRIAVGLVGEGSECFGFDDTLSKDHDFGPGFCMWLTKEDYEKIGEELQNEYEKLPKVYGGMERKVTKHGDGRVGVFEIDTFYEHLLGGNKIPKTEEDWFILEDNQLAAATNGRIFSDPLGSFTGIRKILLAHYPSRVREVKLAKELIWMSQLGQYNFSRMIARNEIVTAGIILHDYFKHTMSAVYLLNRQYAPFYKWMHKGMQHLPVLAEIMDILRAMEDMAIEDERLPLTIEIIAQLVLHELKKQGLNHGEDLYLEKHGEYLLENVEINEYVEQIVALEWAAFDLVKNEGGRADCQNDWNTFSIMRKSQYLTWNKELLRSYIQDFITVRCTFLKFFWRLFYKHFASLLLFGLKLIGCGAP
ncbi:MAG: DUF4125 family protein, partial [Clostridiales bacterium]|nr:DUF4125 family protein [Clostridiales bacterium]